ncbi:hypothetical protein Tco_0565849 [Tanacetum coccineum]
MKRSFQGIHRPLLPAMLTIDAGQPQPSAAPTSSQLVPTPTPSHVQIPTPPITSTPPSSQPPPTLIQPVQSTTPPPQPSNVQLTSSPPPNSTCTIYNTTPSTIQSELILVRKKESKGENEKAPMTEEDLQAEDQASKKSREQYLQELGRLEASQKLQATMDA